MILLLVGIKTELGAVIAWSKRSERPSLTRQVSEGRVRELTLLYAGGANVVLATLIPDFRQCV
jgi:hypothetical protein